MGLAGARACAAAGARLVVVGRNEQSVAAADEALGESGFALAGDATDPTIAVQAIQQANEKYGRFDALYHVAGGSGRRFGDGPLDAITDEDWAKTIELNLSSVFYSNRAAVQHFVRHGTAGSVLNMTSVLATSPSPKFFATHTYATAKAGIIGLTKASAAHYAEQQIRFNALAPALVETPMAARAVEDEAIQQFIKSKQPLDGGRIGRADDLDAAVVFFLSDQSRFATGQVLSIDGGWTHTEGQVG
jgi:NAD(P)-dependent dehydrogenase (short-subunit alcohol dehydrogenase family)